MSSEVRLDFRASSSGLISPIGVGLKQSTAFHLIGKFPQTDHSMSGNKKAIPTNIVFV